MADVTPNFELNNRAVTVRLPRDAAYDLKKIQTIQRTILGQLGHLGCCSGFDIRWDYETEFIVSKAGKVNHLGPQAVDKALGAGA